MTSSVGSIALLWLLCLILAAIARYGLNIRSIKLGWVSISIQTKGFNRGIYNVGRQSHNELRQWFGIGVLVAGMLGISSAFILIRELWQAIKWAEQNSTVVGTVPGGGWVMAVAVPGLTVPWSHAAYLWLATAASFCVHEAGHAFAAAAEGVGIHHVAAFSMLLLPGALVALDTETMAVLSPARVLKIVCGGVWHNAVLCMSCWLVALLLPFLLAPGYITGRGAVVRSVLEESPLANHLRPADLITSINECKVQNQEDWVRCLTNGAGEQRNYSSTGSLTATDLLGLMSQPSVGRRVGYCIPQELQAHSQSCLLVGSQGAQCPQKELCFHEVRQRWRHLSESNTAAAGYRPNATRSMEIDHVNSGFREAVDQQSSRHLAAVGVIEEEGICIGIREAANLQPCGLPVSEGEAGAGTCPAMSTCFKPDLDPAEELLRVCYKLGYASSGPSRNALHSHLQGHMTRSRGSEDSDLGRGLQGIVVGKSEDDLRKRSKRDVACHDFLAFVGSRVSLLQAVEVTNYAPASGWVPMELPHMLEQLLAYTFSVSAALALLNMAPVYGLDGEVALKALLQMGDAGDIFSRPTGLHGRLRLGRRLLFYAVMNIGTAIFGLLLSIHLLRLSGYDAAIMRRVTTVRHLLTFSVRLG